MLIETHHRNRRAKPYTRLFSLAGLFVLAGGSLACSFSAVVPTLAPVKTGMSQVRLIPVLQTYARLWDERDAILRLAGEQGQLDVVVPSIRATRALSDLRNTIRLLGELEEGPDNWKNVAAARYYGVRSITGER